MDIERELATWLDRLKHRVATLSESRQRCAVFVDALVRRSPEEAAQAFHALVEAALTVRDRASKLSVEAVMLALALDQWPREHLAATRASAAASGDALASALLGAEAPRWAAADGEPFPVPSYAGDRPLTLGERCSLAARPDRRLLEMAVRDPHPMVIAKLLDNPRLTERDALFIAARRPAPPEVLGELGTHPKWRLRRRVALALCLNPHTPLRISMTLLLSLPIDDIAVVAETEGVSSLLRIAATAVWDLL